MPGQKTECFIQQDKDCPGMTRSLRIRSRICSSSLPERRLDIFRTDPFGLVMAADGMILYAEEDGLFHEMAAFCAAYAHEEPRRALVLGALSFPVAAMLLKIRGIEQIDLCDPEEGPADILNRYIPLARKTFKDPRVEVFTESPDVFPEQHAGCYDLIFDFTPEAPQTRRTGIRAMKKALAPGGVLAMLAPPCPKSFRRARKELGNLAECFRYVSCAQTPFSAGLYGAGWFFLASDETDPSSPVRRMPGGHKGCGYSRAYHKAIFKHASFREKELLNPGGPGDGEEERND